jgi:hypothetical protein
MRGAGISAFGEPSEVLELVDEQEPPAPAAHADIEPKIPAALREAVSASRLRRDPSSDRRDLSAFFNA